MTKELLWFSSNVASLSYVSAGGFASVIIFDSFGGDIAVVVIRKKVWPNLTHGLDGL